MKYYKAFSCILECAHCFSLKWGVINTITGAQILDFTSFFFFFTTYPIVRLLMLLAQSDIFVTMLLHSRISTTDLMRTMLSYLIKNDGQNNENRYQAVINQNALH